MSWLPNVAHIYSQNSQPVNTQPHQRPPRSKNPQDFQSKEIDLMVATDAYGQGIDKADIRLIVHWEPPVNFEM